MHAFHSNWTGPFFAKYPHGKYEVEDFELLTTIISALKWQELNGDIEMITDKKGARYYSELGLTDLWNKGIDESLEEIDTSIDGSTFWAAGKLYALSKQKMPCVMLDTDFIIWEDLNEELKKHDVTVIHKETLSPDVYPDGNCFVMNEHYTYPVKWDWTQLPCNTAFTFFNDIAFKDYYVSEALRFMKAAKGVDPLIYMVFAEQRMLAMCAKEKNIDIFAFATLDELFSSHQTKFTHIWGHKRHLRAFPNARHAFCKRCIDRIRKDYPSFYPRLLTMEIFQNYI